MKKIIKTILSIYEFVVATLTFWGDEFYLTMHKLKPLDDGEPKIRRITKTYYQANDKPQKVKGIPFKYQCYFTSDISRAMKYGFLLGSLAVWEFRFIHRKDPNMDFCLSLVADSAFVDFVQKGPIPNGPIPESLPDELFNENT